MDKIVLAFSGGLDTSFCAIWLREKTSCEIVTVCVDTGGFAPGELDKVEARARALGIQDHRTVDGKQAVYDRFVSYLIKGNCLRGGVYPMCVGAERVVQAEEAVRIAEEIGAKGVAHGSTGAGNDQVRFDVAIRALAPRLEIHAPVRELNWSRDQESAWLAERGIHTPPKTTAYSVNVGLFGTTIGGKETHDTWAMPPEEVYGMTVPPEKASDQAEELVLSFEHGLPVALDGNRMDGIELLTALNERAKPHGVGRGVHVGDTILGLKGRLAFEAPGPLILIKAHRDLEKLVQTKWQSFWRDTLGDFYGGLLHEGLYYDPVMRDLEAFLDSVNARVTGDVRVKLYKGGYDVVGMRSPESLFDRKVATYGEGTKAWSGADAAGFSKIYGVPAMLAALRDPEVVMKIRAHKFGSVVSRLNLGPEVEISRKVEARSGQVVVVRALEEKRVYDQLELTSGRMAHVGKGDVIVGALGRRDALRGFQGIVPAQARAGDTLHLLNLGGVIGEAVSENRDFGHPLRCELLGMATRDDKGLNIADAALPHADHISPTDCPPIIVVSGTCMNAGKTVACCEIIAKLTARGYACAGLKMTGVACQKDLLNMEDHGALATLSFLDCGYPSTAGVANVAPVAKGLLKAIAGETDQELDVVVVEMGDGIIGAYGVRSVLEDPEIRALFKAHVLCANDLVAAWGGVQYLKAMGLAADVIAGPATDNDVGIRYISTELGIPAANARVEPDRFADLVEQRAFGT